MDKLIKKPKVYIFLLTIVAVCAVVFYCIQEQEPIEVVQAQVQVDLYGVFETEIINSNSYSNRFDFSEIELQATFTSHTGRTIDFFGFYAGDGNGGQSGSVWKLRFMPDEIGTWSYTYTWVGTGPKPTGGSGNFNVVDTGLPGPLKVATDNPWYFMTFRGEPFHARPYDLHHLGPAGAAAHPLFPDSEWNSASDLYIQVIETNMTANGYNLAMVDSPSRAVGHSWWYNNQKDVFNVEVWDDYEKILQYSLENEIYLFSFDGMVYQSDMSFYSTHLSKYMVARFGAYASYMGYSPTWEWTDIWTPVEMDWIMQFTKNLNPFPILFSAHDCSQSTFTGWLSFSMRQAQSRNISAGNDRRAGQQQGDCDGLGGVGDPFLNKPIIGSEDIWERPGGEYDQPRNAVEVRRGAWGIMMAGVMPLYSEWDMLTGVPGEMPGELEVRRMFDFFYSKTDYRRYQQLNGLVSSSAEQICSGIVGEEYLVYDQNGGSINIDLSGVSSSVTFDVLWYDPKTGIEQSGGNVNGGAYRNLNSPYSGDSVLYLTNQTASLCDGKSCGDSCDTNKICNDDNGTCVSKQDIGGGCGCDSVCLSGSCNICADYAPGCWLCQAAGPSCLAPDISSCDQIVGIADLSALKTLWGQAGTADLNQDGITNVSDLGIMMSAWGSY